MNEAREPKLDEARSGYMRLNQARRSIDEDRGS